MDPIGFLTTRWRMASCSAACSRRCWSAIVCAVMGTFVVLKGLAFIGDAVSHAAFPGLVIAYLLGLPLYIGGVDRGGGHGARDRLGLAPRARCASTPPVGVLFAGTFAFGVAALQHDQGLRRRPARLPARATCWASPTATSSSSRYSASVVLAVVVVLRKELLYATFDPQGAAASGLPVGWPGVPAARRCSA